MFRIVVENMGSDGALVKGEGEEVLRLVVDVIDLKKVVAAVLSKPRGPRAKKGEKA